VSRKCLNRVNSNGVHWTLTFSLRPYFHLEHRQTSIIIEDKTSPLLIRLSKTLMSECTTWENEGESFAWYSITFHYSRCRVSSNKIVTQHVQREARFILHLAEYSLARRGFHVASFVCIEERGSYQSKDGLMGNSGTVPHFSISNTHPPLLTCIIKRKGLPISSLRGILLDGGYNGQQLLLIGV